MREAIDGDKMFAANLSILGPSQSIPVALVGSSASAFCICIYLILLRPDFFVVDIWEIVFRFRVGGWKKRKKKP